MNYYLRISFCFFNKNTICILFLSFFIFLNELKAEGYVKSEITKIIFLGTGNPNPDPNHLGVSVLLLVNNIPYIFDCGPGLVRNASKLNPKYGGKLNGFDVKNLNKVFISHLHSDHTLGYPDLILTPWVMGRVVPIEAFGPTGLKAMTDNILEAYKEDINIRITGLEKENDIGWRVKVNEIKEGIIYKDTNISVEAFSVEHGNWKESYGFLIITPDRKIVISGDCRPSKKLMAKSKNVDILIHEVYSAEKLKTRESKWQKYHPQFHTSTYELGEMASQIKPALLLLYHQLYWGDSDIDLVKQIKTKWNGNVISAQDMDEY